MAFATLRCARLGWKTASVSSASALMQISVRSVVLACDRNGGVVKGMMRSRCATHALVSSGSCHATEFRWLSTGNLRQSPGDAHRKRTRTTLYYLISVAVLLLGLSYAAVPMYRVFCQVTGIGGASNLAKHDADKVESMKKVADQKLTIRFNADTASHLHWHFKPLQREVVVYPGETALAFYTATNPTDRPITGISTYTVLPYEAAKYLNKIQCFCFEEQRLNPHEQVDMPVFFYIDPEFVNDPWLQKTKTVTLSYTFFESKEGNKFLGGFQPHTWSSAKPQPSV
ncbi:cytochrome c oxidase assembly protein COX11, mitochondrial-like isoform X2 [Paramacrobiotus metropolitanus]|uniref:cytochrome c oxidase assembly protein COX11, mitochondrial-like isoform X2 n=1 Tax=Paramacrobiotus metropolitanus TaxID=2943436 RepID=UPI0024463202|nr:cytochrome c oxidase assembly protein COX11, mitochondrial-like isoform X2 [Paramacrobiotus metropolitanus]